MTRRLTRLRKWMPPALPGRARVFLLPIAFLIGSEGAAQVVTLMDVRDVAALPGASSQSIGVVLSNANGLTSFEFDLSVSPPGVLQNIRTERGAATAGFDFWEAEATDESIHVAGGTTQDPVSTPSGRDSEIARLAFDVASTAVVGQTVSLVLARASTSLPFDLLTDLGVFVAGNGPAPITRRNLKIELVPTEVFPGDSVQFSVYVNDVPHLTSAQIFFSYPDGALLPDGEVGGQLVESLGWNGAFVEPKQIGNRPFILVDRLFGSGEAPGLGKILVATLPFQIGADWGGEWRGFEVLVDDTILYGDLLAGDENLYHANNEETGVEQEPPDLNGDGVLDSDDVFEFGQHWRNGEGSR